MESVGCIHHQRKVINHGLHLLPRHRLHHRPPSLQLHTSRTATTRFPFLSVVASSSSSLSTPSPPPRRDPTSLPGLLLCAVKPIFISLTAATAVFLATPLLRRPSSLAHALATSAYLEKKQQQQPEKGASATDEEQELALESKLRAFPDDKVALRGLLELCVRQQRAPDALALANRLAALDPNDSDLLILRAHLHKYVGDTKLSREAFEEIIEKDPTVVGAYHGLVMLAAEAEEGGGVGEIGKVIERVEAALIRCREEGKTEEARDFRLLLAQVRVLAGEYERALQLYRELVKEEPRDFRPYLCQGVILTMLEMEDEAEKQFDQYRKLLPKGHPYAQHFDENMALLMGLRHMEENRRS